MNPRKIKLVAAKVKKSPSNEAFKRTIQRASQGGGVSVDAIVGLESLRDVSRKLNYNIFNDASFIYIPSSYGESRNYSQNPYLRNLLINSDIGTTQSKSITSQVYTLSFKGTGSYTLSGAYSGSLVGTGVSNRVVLTFTPIAGTLTLTVSGSITEIQLELGSVATPYQRTTDGIIDFTSTRATTSRVTNKQGVIEDSCYNLLLNSTWTGGGTTPTNWTLVGGSGTSTPVTSILNNGGTAYRFQTSVSRQNFTQIAPVVSNTTYTLSCYVEQVNISERVQNVLNHNTSGALLRQYYEDDIPISSTYLIQAGKYYSLVIQATETVNSRLFQIGTSVVSSTTTSDYTLSSPQYITGSTLRPYLITTNRLNIPKLDYSLSLAEPSLLIEPQSTNLILQSETLDNASWLKPNAPIVINTNANPFGVNKSYYLTEDTNNTSHYITQSRSITTATAYVASFYVKKATNSWIQIGFNTVTFGANAWVNFNFDTGLFGNSGGTGTWTQKILTNGYYLLTFSATSTTTTTNNTLYLTGTNNTDTLSKLPTYTGTGLNICDIAAMQLEARSSATSYISTTTATVTRNGDTNFVDLFNNNMLNKTNWTLFYEGYLYNSQTTNMSFCLSDTNTATSNTNQIGFFDGIQPFYNIGNVRTNGVVSVSNNSFNKFVIQYNNGTVKFFRNGVQVWTNQSVPVFDYRYIVLSNGNSTYTVDKIVLFSRNLSDSEAILLTTL